MKATLWGVCPRCHMDIRPGDVIVPRHGAYIHAECAPGGGDE